ncbi:hypothetical protein [Alloscardovia omnicolens]|jgi:hypothetical protein|uniref:Uncharacterized protein n=2 Tax=Alloscardovia omnicolens TaxID=419015 RepID=U1SKX7_9BIFI|nr:hypothetical protein [Alloscardovia omnicolens]ERH31322.1 hypothetical protein HMPREF9244_00566 [Alloscardovia omnicolens F0580]KWZ75443.1 hypothetical protein HMPREF3214_00484 [Alloscardovia omnicolens]MBS6346418.1 hypothetical protein [Alloscardovia omnicolens]MDK6251679.1 hypothetical protein [Alloscardovia omnicolens]MDK6444978.1 hypothetical protein [Alloscardovia omnicolens]
MAGLPIKRRKTERKYIIRRAVALAVLFALIIGGGWGVYAAFFARDTNKVSTARSNTSTSSTKKSNKEQQNSTEGVFRSDRAKDSGIPDCTTQNVAVKLTADPTEITTNGTVNFAKDFTHTGSTDCILNVSDASMVITMTNAEGVQVWRSDACEADPAVILLGQNDTYQKKSSWNAVVSNVAVDNSINGRATINGSGHGCMNEGQSARHVAAGEYTAEMVNIADNTMKSEPIKITVKEENQ